LTSLKASLSTRDVNRFRAYTAEVGIGRVPIKKASPKACFGILVL